MLSSGEWIAATIAFVFGLFVFELNFYRLMTKLSDIENRLHEIAANTIPKTFRDPKKKDSQFTKKQWFHHGLRLEIVIS